MMFNNLKTFDLSDYEKVEDIIFYDQPILTHYLKTGSHYLSYLIDTTENYDACIFFKVSEESLKDYLNNHISLREMILGQEGFAIAYQEDFSGEITMTYPLDPNSILEDHLPAEDSYSGFKPVKGSYYWNFLNDQGSNYEYLRELRKSAFYLRFYPSDPKYAHTFSLPELSKVLLNPLNSSYNQYQKADFKFKFAEKYSDPSKLNKVFNSLVGINELRAVDGRFKSFEVGIATENLMNKNVTTDIDLQKWVNGITKSYLDEVLTPSIAEKSIDNIEKRFSNEERRKIFKPIIDIASNDKFELKVRRSQFTSYKNVRFKNKDVIQRLAPEPEYILKEEEDFKILTLTTMVNAKKLPKKIDVGTSLFSQAEEAIFPLLGKHFKDAGFDFTPNETISVKVEIKEGEQFLSATYQDETFTVLLSKNDIKAATDTLVKKIFEFSLNQ